MPSKAFLLHISRWRLFHTAFVYSCSHNVPLSSSRSANQRLTSTVAASQLCTPDLDLSRVTFHMRGGVQITARFEWKGGIIRIHLSTACLAEPSLALPSKLIG